MAFYDKDEVKNALDIEDVFDILESLNAEPDLRDDYITAITVCHGGDSHKLYYYDNTKLFKCFTHCGTMDIFELLMKIKQIDLNTAVSYVVNFFNLGWKIKNKDDVDNFLDWRILDKYEYITNIKINNQKAVFPEIDSKILQYFPQPRILNWEQEHIPKEISDYMDIHYNPLTGGILIPHTDENNRLIGIRERTLVQENEKYGKYRPARINGNMYNHALGFNLYGFYQAKENIKNTQIALILEAEKSVLQAINYLGIANNIAVAVCGSTLSSYQLQMLLDIGVKEIAIGFDADYQKIGDKEYEETIKKFEKIYNKYCGYVNISFLFDINGNLLEYKNSPTDKGKDVFFQLWRNRIFL